MMVDDYVRWDDGQFDDDYFPLVLWGQMLDQKFYDELKGTWPNFNEYKTESFGQRFRDNLLITQQMRSPTSPFYREHYAWLQLEAYLASSVFISKLIAMFPNSMFDKHGFIGKLENLSLDFQLCEAFSGYENPWHVDTRKRIFHMLLYFGEDGIESGGEIGLAVLNPGKIGSIRNFHQQTISSDQNITSLKTISGWLYYRHLIHITRVCHCWVDGGFFT